MTANRHEDISTTEADTWGTGITYTAPGVVAPRGYPVEQLMGRASFTEVVCLMFRGELPDDRTRQLLDAILVASVDHSTTSPSAMTARTVASSGADVQLAATAGLLAINRSHGGALGPCMVVLQDVVDRARDADGDMQTAASGVVADFRMRQERIPGFGHRVHNIDPRTDRLFSIANGLGFDSEFETAARAVERELSSADKKIPMNLDGAIAALLCALQIPVDLANPLFMISRFVGITMQAYEEHTRHRPMRKIYMDRHRYDGEPLRDVPEKDAY